ncbi:hypothetical protein CP965_07145 [Halarcobacter mediterraneus]|uniref:Uncharacterized protein n=1 Tax=Halarcobacter mediterraneus TaxID=2023153 RepID=A0A4Q1B0G1_9BACT|nr:hypothetical protein [Halarcobacter mediterraneus]RXK13569.1 hypothetical protein CP965_07145 [Halarcobacter mediterraneus]
MHKVVVEQECGCFKRSDLENNLEFTSKDEALSKAIQMKNQMNLEFCKKHDFDLVEQGQNFIINFRQEAPSTCCGSGCCM